jgi:polyhydroxybutyrate depolymerase
MILLRAALVLLLLAVTPANAERFDGRTLIVTDGRPDTAEAAPLVVVLHGLTGSGRIMQRKTGFDALARTHSFVVAYPNGKLRRWRFDAGSDDVTYLKALLGAFTRDYNIDPAQIYLVGYSNGGAMALRLACDLQGRLKAIAVVAMTQPSELDCPHRDPVPALFIHGKLDPVVPAAGLAAQNGKAPLLSLAQTEAFWAARNRCAGVEPLRIWNQIDGSDEARLTRYTGCTAPLETVVLTGQGHNWPGARPSLRFVLGPASREMDAAVFSWLFFARQ